MFTPQRGAGSFKSGRPLWDSVPKSAPEKLTAAMWPKPRDSSIKVDLDVDAEPIQALIQAASKAGLRVTPTAIVAKAAAQVLEDYPRLNRDVRGWRLRDREAVDVWVTMSDDDGRLLGRRVEGMDERDLVDVQTEITEHGDAHKDGTSFTSRLVHGIVRWTPLPILRGVVRSLEFILHTLRVPIGLLGIDREGFGAVHVTNVGPFGIRHVSAPIPPITGQSFLLVVGRTHEKPVVRDGEVVPGTVLPLTATLDHRVVVGVEAGRWATRFEEVLTDPAWLVEQMPEEDRGSIRASMDALLEGSRTVERIR